IRRIICRTSSSAVEVTVHVFNTTTSAWRKSLTEESPRAARPAASAAPSACEARQPKFLIQKVLKKPFSHAPAPPRGGPAGRRLAPADHGSGPAHPIWVGAWPPASAK